LSDSGLYSMEKISRNLYQIGAPEKQH